MKKILLSFIFCFSLFIESIAQKPLITSINPLNANVGAAVTLTGSNFNPVPGNNVVFFGAVAKTATAVTSTTLTVNVPPGASYGPIIVVNTATSRSGQSTLYFNPTFTPTKGAVTAGDIAAKIDIPIAAGPFKILVADVDSDGKPDLIMANVNANTVSVLRNVGTDANIAPGTFAPEVDFAIHSPSDMAVGDVDGDGKPDLVVASYNQSRVFVLRNTSSIGNISFIQAYDRAVGQSPSAVAMGDFNNDGKPELAIVWRSSPTNNIMVLNNSSTPGNMLIGPALIFSAGSDPNALAIADMDGDGNLDLVVANRGGNDVSVLRNRGGINFDNALAYQVGESPWGLAVGDIDGDGKPDIATANADPKTVSLLRNTGTSANVGFATRLDLSVDLGAFAVAIGDVDGDGKPDLVTANRTAATTSVLRNAGSSGQITFATAVNFAVGAGASSIAVADLNNDGKPELITANSNASSISVLRNDPQYQQPQTINPIAAVNSTYGDAHLVLTATASSGLEVIYHSADNSIAEAYRDAADGNKWKLKFKKSGSVAVTASQAGNTFFFAAPDVVFQVNINKKPIRVTAVAKSKTYGDADPALTYTFLPALVGADVFTGTLTRTPGDNAGTYSIDQGTLSLNDNYTFIYNPANLVVAKKSVNVAVQPKSKTYGNADPTLTYTFMPALVGNDAFTGTLVRAQGENAGTYTINQGTLNLNNNYTLVFSPANLVIAKRSVNITVQAKNKTYGDADPSFTYTSEGLIGADALSGSLQRIAGENAGAYTIGEGSLSGGLNYDLVTTTAQFTISKALLTITAANAGICQNSPLPAFKVNYSGFKRGDTENSLSQKPAINTTATSASAAGNYLLVPYGAVSANYEFVYENGTLVISAMVVISISSDKGDNISKGEQVTLRAPQGLSYNWTGPDITSGQGTAVITVRPLANATYTVNANNAQGCSQSASFSLSVRNDFQAVKAKNILTPNSDGFNDTWVVDNIDYYPNNTVRIFDRNSRIVYTKQKYDNSWNGQYNGEALPGGTYYFIIDFGDGKLKQKGFITLVR